MTYTINAQWDPEAKVWTATSDQIPGLAIEAETMEELVKRLRVTIPELLELNQVIKTGDEIVFQLCSERREVVRAH